MSEMQSITLSTKQLHTLLDPVMPFAANPNPYSLPVIESVRITSHGEWLVAAATDRFRVAMKRIKSFDADRQPAIWPEFSAVVPVRSLKSIFATFKSTRHKDPELKLSTSASQLHVEASGGLDFERATVAYALTVGKFPAIETIVDKAQKREPTTAVTSFDPSLMADFRAVGGTLTMKFGESERDPIFLTDSRDFVGLLMPRKVSLDAVAAPWDDLLGAGPVNPAEAETPKQTQPSEAVA